MSTIDSIETAAETVEQAIEQALAQLGIAREAAEIEVIAEPRQGVLGLGARQAQVRVTRRSIPAAAAPGEPPSGEPAGEPRSPAPLEEQARAAAAILAQILELMNEKAEVRTLEIDPESIELEIKGDGSGLLIGRHGQTLDALEYLVNRLLARRVHEAAAISLEIESYRARRREQLHRMALSMGERAKRDHTPLKLEPMAPRDRRIVHLALKDDPMLTTRSAGDGFLRAVEIVPAGGGNRPPRPEPKGPGQGRGRRRDRPRPQSEAIGEQGGFKHGQKRIV
ncbi:MAG: RNA-binding cell elongation regulator Jag/EloR [Candidatus Binataceae bacterium]